MAYCPQPTAERYARQVAAQHARDAVSQFYLSRRVRGADAESCVRESWYALLALAIHPWRGRPRGVSASNRQTGAPSSSAAPGERNEA